MSNISKIASTFLAICVAPIAMAQDLSDEELLSRFLNQRDVFKSVEGADMGQTRSLTTRGLKLVTVDDATATSAKETTGVAVNSTPADQNKPLVIGVLEPELQVNLRISFGFDSAAIATSEKPKLTQMCNVMKSSDIKLFRVIGHTDSSGSDAYNERLSVLRAEEVARFLVDDCGMAPTRLETIGLGERFLFDANDPDAEENRRVEFQAIS